MTGGMSSRTKGKGIMDAIWRHGQRPRTGLYVCCSGSACRTNKSKRVGAILDQLMIVLVPNTVPIMVELGVLVRETISLGWADLLTHGQ